MKQKTLALEQIYREGAGKLSEAGIEEACLDAWYLLEHVTGISKAAYYGDPGKEISKEEAHIYREYIGQRAKRIPLQHITGSQVFMGYTFKVDKNVLIPRQDTEILVEEAAGFVRPGMNILDMCTGSGCILLSLLKMKEGMKLKGTGCDISQEALEIAKENAGRLEVEAEFMQSDLFGSVEGRYDMILSNPPYIPTAVIEQLQEEVRVHDPRIALDGKEDGLEFYRRIIADSVRYLNPQGILAFEIGHDQAEAVSDLMEKRGYRNIRVKKDLAGLDRVVAGMYNSNDKF